MNEEQIERYIFNEGAVACFLRTTDLPPPFIIKRWSEVWLEGWNYQKNKEIRKMRVNYVDLRLPEHRDIPIFKSGSVEAIGVDIRAYLPDEPFILMPQCRALIPTGFKIAIPIGYYGRIAPRSGLAVKNGIDTLAGVVDSDYRGEVRVALYNTDKDQAFPIENGDRIAQLIMERAEMWVPEELHELSETERGEKGYGSSGRN
jgi:dUTP pyrophosphatase